MTPVNAPRALASRLTALRTWPAAAALVLAACAQSPPAEQVPTLDDQLAAVDSAIAREDYDAAHRALDRLIRTTARAQQDEQLGQAQADAIIAAATRVKARLPDPGPASPEPESTPSPEQQPRGPDGGDGDEDDDEGDGDEGDGNEDDGNEGEGHGNGPSSGNGPDDGHGN